MKIKKVLAIALTLSTFTLGVIAYSKGEELPTVAFAVASIAYAALAVMED